MYWIPIAVTAYLLLKTRNENNHLKINDMANCNKLFLDFNDKLKITSSKIEKMKTARENIKSKITAYFKDKAKYEFLGTYMQGSYKTKTVIRTVDDTCDLDLGIYFKKIDTEVSAAAVMDQVFKAVEDVTSTKPSKKGKCIRVYYKGDFHIDLPVYHFNKEVHNHPQLATRNNGWEESDPKDFTKWFNKHDNKKQLKRIIRYLKAWSVNTDGKYPSGLAFTIWACQNLSANERDDIALYDLLKNIKSCIENSWEVEMPVVPYDNVCSKLTEQQKENFLNAISNFIEDAEKAIKSKNQLEASKIWQKYFGDRFPVGADEDVDAKEAALRSISNKVLAGTAYSQRSGDLTEDKDGVKNKPHTNYGG